MQSGLVLLNASRRGYCHIANDLIIWKLNSISPMQSTAKFNFPVSQNEVKSYSKIRYPAHARVVPFSVNRKLRIFSCFLLASIPTKFGACIKNRMIFYLNRTSSRRLKVTGERKNGTREGNTMRGEKKLPLPSRVSLSRAVLSCAVTFKRLLSGILKED